MRRRFRVLGLPRLGLALGLLALLTSEVKADLSVNNLGLYDGANAPIVEIKYTGNSGVWVYGDAQTATNWTFPNGSPIPLYCIDLTHENAVGDSYALIPWSSPSFSTSDAANRIAWAIENGGLSGLGPAATQLLIWSIIDNRFGVISWNNNIPLETAYNNMVSELNNSSSGYNASDNYLPGVEFLSAFHDSTGTLYQDLAVAADPAPAPEPSTLAIATLGALGLIGYGWRRRARYQV